MTETQWIGFTHVDGERPVFLVETTSGNTFIFKNKKVEATAIAGTGKKKLKLLLLLLEGLKNDLPIPSEKITEITGIKGGSIRATVSHLRTSFMESGFFGEKDKTEIISNNRSAQEKPGYFLCNIRLNSKK